MANRQDGERVDSWWGSLTRLLERKFILPRAMEENSNFFSHQIKQTKRCIFQASVLQGKMTSYTFENSLLAFPVCSLHYFHIFFLSHFHPLYVHCTQAINTCGWFNKLFTFQNVEFAKNCIEIRKQKERSTQQQQWKKTLTCVNNSNWKYLRVMNFALAKAKVSCV